MSIENHLLIELHVDDFDLAKKYYSLFGFEIAREDLDDGYGGYLAMEFEGNIICFWPGDDSVFNQTHFAQFPADTPRGYGVEIVVMVDDIEKLYDSVKDTANVVEPLRIRPWGKKDFRVTDPFGYYLRFTQRYSFRTIGQKE